MAEPAEVFHYEPHPRIAERAKTPPPKVDDEHVGFNGRLAALTGIMQMLLMIAIMVGQQVLGQAADKRATQTYKDAEAILHECQQLQAHLQSQDGLLSDIAGRGRAR